MPVRDRLGLQVAIARGCGVQLPESWRDLVREFTDDRRPKLAQSVHEFAGMLDASGVDVDFLYGKKLGVVLGALGTFYCSFGDELNQTFCMGACAKMARLLENLKSGKSACTGSLCGRANSTRRLRLLCCAEPTASSDAAAGAGRDTTTARGMIIFSCWRFPTLVVCLRLRRFVASWCTEHSLLNLVRRDPANVLQMSPEELELLIRADKDLIKRVLKRDDHQVASFIDYCEREKVRSESLTEAVQILAAKAAAQKK
jgi:hypothetical protein